MDCRLFWLSTFPALISPFLTLAGALGGVYLGGVLARRREAYFRELDRQQRSAYLAIVINNALDEFANACFDVVQDDGLIEGPPNIEGVREAQVEAPTFEVKAYDVDWRSIPAELADAVWSLPSQILEARAQIRYQRDIAIAPDYEEYFEERRILHTIMGLHAVRTAEALRKNANLPPRSYRKWDMEAGLQQWKASLEDERAKRLERLTPMDQL